MGTKHEDRWKILWVEIMMCIVVMAMGFLIGEGQVTSLVCMPTMLASYFGHKTFHTPIKAKSFAAAIVIAGGPVLVALSFARIGTYAAASTVVSGALLLGSLLIFLRRPPQLAESGKSAWVPRFN